MSVLIKGKEMPENCDCCMFSRRSIHNIDWCVLTEKDLPCDCPIVPVPPHGRLIDGDKFYEDINESVLLTDGFKEAFNLWYDEQDSIIPAEEGE